MINTISSPLRRLKGFPSQVRTSSQLCHLSLSLSLFSSLLSLSLSLSLARSLVLSCSHRGGAYSTTRRKDLFVALPCPASRALHLYIRTHIMLRTFSAVRQVLSTHLAQESLLAPCANTLVTKTFSLSSSSSDPAAVSQVPTTSH